MTPSPVELAGPSRPAIAEHVSITRVFGHSNNEQVRKLTDVKSPFLIGSIKKIYFNSKNLFKVEISDGNRNQLRKGMK